MQRAPNLDTFRAHGHKLLMYHGWNDPVVAPGGAIDYYNSVVTRDARIKLSTQQEPNAAPHQSFLESIGSSYRLFMVPGMEHCGGGPGPSDFDPLDAVVQWVEKGNRAGFSSCTKNSAGQRGKRNSSATSFVSIPSHGALSRKRRCQRRGELYMCGLSIWIFPPEI